MADAGAEQRRHPSPQPNFISGRHCTAEGRPQPPAATPDTLSGDDLQLTVRVRIYKIIGLTGLGVHCLAKADLRRNRDEEIAPPATEGLQ